MHYFVLGKLHLNLRVVAHGLAEASTKFLHEVLNRLR